jgi:very-short-patch-repair endonuclease
MPKKLTNQEFIEKSNTIHNNKFDYSLVEYKNNFSKVKIICPIHGEFEQNPKNHMKGFGCVKCLGEYKLTTDRFIIFSNDIHHNKFDYSLVKYTNMRTKVKIICPIHNIFEQTPNNHLKGCGCPTCGNVKVPTTLEFVEKANIIHNNKYNYSLSEYYGAKIKIKIICPEHGIFEQEPHNHINGQGCPKCEGKQLTKTEIIEKFKNIHNNKYDYSLVEYVNNKNNIKIICPKHGIFEQTPQSHLSGKGCQICGGSKKKTQSEFIEKSNKIQNMKYDYSLVEYTNAKTKVKITCPKHGVFEQKPTHHLAGVGCPSCCESHGEKDISTYLDENNIKYIRQHKFDDCKYKYKLPFDFYLPDYNICIEYDGMQHFKPIAYFGGEKTLKYTKENDNIKNDYCKNNNINLLRIKYNENILNKLKSFLEK